MFGFNAKVAAAVVAAVFIVGGGGYAVYQTSVKHVSLGQIYSNILENVGISPERRACTQEAKQCPDGSYVGRTGPNCEFAPCHSETSCEGGACSASARSVLLK